ncbi:glycosyltransferase family 4 protein [Hansschlegelia quercus]|uniref:Glycosyltransferase n=1 Tax=Hansschlegelia quercus TaxID=2528245 RepID=A0A4Q9GLT5_9HYPH|nr:glycosyltransferase family 4 protein [Hansschlegelia quercus]TBN54045.1 glycosyltransferase [Hansschlegelia quercus]
MHVMLANNIYPPIAAGGAELIVAYLAEELVRRGAQVTVVSTCGPEMEPYPVEQRNGVEVVRFFPKNVYWHFDRGHAKRLDKMRWHLTDAWNRDAARRIRTIMDQRRPDLFHTHLVDGFSASIWRSAQRAGLPVVHTAHDYHLICPRAFMLSKSWKLCTNPSLGCRTYRRWHVATAKDIDVFCSPSRFLIDQHVAAGLKVADTRVVRNGIPLPDALPAAKGEGPLRLLMPARLTVEKGVRVVLDAMRLIGADTPVELHVAGRGALEPEVQAAAAADPRIRYHGYVSGDQKATLFSQADVFLLPSLWYENAPVVIVEAAAYGLGVIASRIGAIPEFVRDGETGVLFEPGSAEDLASTIRRVAHDPQLRQVFREKSGPFAQSFTVERMCDAYQAVYSDLLARRAGEQGLRRAS